MSDDKGPGAPEELLDDELDGAQGGELSSAMMKSYATKTAQANAELRSVVNQMDAYIQKKGGTSKPSQQFKKSTN